MTISAETARVLDLAVRQGLVAVRMDIVTDCHCGGVGTMKQDGQIATGLPVVDTHSDFRYVPQVGEVLKNHHMVCSACGFEQWS